MDGGEITIEALAAEADARLEALRLALDGLSSEGKARALAGIHRVAPSVGRLINPFYGRFAGSP